MPTHDASGDQPMSNTMMQNRCCIRTDSIPRYLNTCFCHCLEIPHQAQDSMAPAFAALLVPEETTGNSST